MIKKYVTTIDKDFVLKPISIKEGTGLMIPSFLGERELMKETTILVPDYEKTNREFADKISSIIKLKAKEFGEITKIELDLCRPKVYRLIISGYHEKVEEEIDVPEHYGEGD